MQRANRHFRANWWFNAFFLRSISMIVNNVWSIRKKLGITERVEDVRTAIARYILRDLKNDFESKYGKNDVFGEDYVPMYRRSRETLNSVRLDGANDHFPTSLKGVYRQCVYHRNGSKTSNYCVKCRVHLHTGACYQKWHTEK